MKPIKKWLAQNDDGMCYIYAEKPKYSGGKYYTRHFDSGFIGMFVIRGFEKQVPTVECIVMTKEDYVKLKERKSSVSNIAPIKRWLAQDDDGACHLHHEKPKYNNGKYTTNPDNAGHMGMNLFDSDVTCIECIVMTEEYYEKLKGKKPRASKET